MEFTDEERALIDEAAEATVKRRLAVPAMMFLETVSPMNTVAASMLHMITPLWGMVLSADRIQQLATLLEQRASIPAFIQIIDEAEELRRGKEQADRTAQRAQSKARKQQRREQKLQRKQNQGTSP